MKLEEGRAELTSGGSFIHFYNTTNGDNRIARTEELPRNVLKSMLVGYVPKTLYMKFERRSTRFGNGPC